MIRYRTEDRGDTIFVFLEANGEVTASDVAETAKAILQMGINHRCVVFDGPDQARIPLAYYLAYEVIAGNIEACVGFTPQQHAQKVIKTVDLTNQSNQLVAEFQ